MTDTAPCRCNEPVNLKAPGRGIGQIPGWIIGYMRLRGIADFGVSASFLRKNNKPNKLFGRLLAAGLSNEEAFCICKLSVMSTSGRIRQTIYSIYGCPVLMLYDSMHKSCCKKH